MTVPSNIVYTSSVGVSGFDGGGANISGAIVSALRDTSTDLGNNNKPNFSEQLELVVRENNRGSALIVSDVDGDISVPAVAGANEINKNGREV
ncbi:MAG: hypothetical protein R3D71_03540 [Rickettsiales bacterium]